MKMARLTGLEPATPGVTGRYSNQLSYNRASSFVTFTAAVARLTGLEPATPGVTGRYSNQLSYNRSLPVQIIERKRRSRPVGWGRQVEKTDGMNFRDNNVLTRRPRQIPGSILSPIAHLFGPLTEFQRRPKMF